MIATKYKRKVFEEASFTSHLTYQIGELNSLREKSEPVKEIESSQTKLVISKLRKTLKEYRKLTGKGRGIAAIQIGYALRIAAIFEEKEILVIINPRIINRSKKLLRFPEICMSANPIIAPVVRPSFIEFEYLNEKGEKVVWSEKENKIMNRVFQHEIDHMEGIINIDLVPSKDLILNSDPKFFKEAKFEEV